MVAPHFVQVVLRATGLTYDLDDMRDWSFTAGTEARLFERLDSVDTGERLMPTANLTYFLRDLREHVEKVARGRVIGVVTLAFERKG